jgi:DNA-binding MarR family transcriptional regulator
MSSPRSTKQTRIDALVDEFRHNGNLDRAFDNLAARRLGVNVTDLDCLNVIERRGSLTAGELATEAGLTSGAITGVIDRLERAGFARRTRDPDDRRRVTVAVTPAFYAAAGEIWGPVKQDWDTTVAGRFTAEQLDLIVAFLRTTNEITRRHLERIESGPGRRPSSTAA